MPQPFLILSHHRSGSNFLAELIQQNSKFSIVDEPLSMHTTLFKDIDLIPWVETDFRDGVFHDDLESHPELVSFLKDLREWLKLGDSCYTRGIKETLLFEKLDWLNAFLPSLKVIFLVRDPRAVVASVLRSNMYVDVWKYPKTIPRHMALFEGTSINGGLSSVELIVHSWRIRHDYVRRYNGLFNHTCVRLEDFIWLPEPTLTHVMNFLDADPSRKQFSFLLNSHSKSNRTTFSPFRTAEDILTTWKRVLTSENQQFIEDTLGREMEEFGYL